MALIDENQIKERDMSGAFAGTKANLPGFNAVRRPTALVVDLLLRSNNFFVTGNAGLRALGIKDGAQALVQEIEGKKNPKYDPQAMLLVVPQIANVAALLICSEEDLDACAEDIKHVEKLGRSIMQKNDTIDVVNLLPSIYEQFEKIKISSAVVPEQRDNGASLSLVDAKKKRNRTG